METRASYLLVGAFVLAIMAGALVFVIWLTGATAEKTVNYHMRFEGSVTGLQVGSQDHYLSCGLPTPYGRHVGRWKRNCADQPAPASLAQESHGGCPFRG